LRRTMLVPLLHHAHTSPIESESYRLEKKR
jgi:hypothetical protein